MKKGNATVSSFFFVLSVIVGVLAIIDAFKVNVWLSATSWLVIAAVLGIWAVYIKLCSCKCCEKED
jgi:hypothetical protein